MKMMRLDNSSSIYLKIAVVVALVLFVVLARTAPHPANFAPVAAVALFAGAILPRKWALSAPLAAMIASDLIIGMHSLVFVTWGSFLLIALASHRFLGNVNKTKVVLGSVSASVFFFIATNFAVWAQGMMYPLNAGGLIHSYVNALPFFRGTLTGDLFYSGVLFGAYAFVTYLATEKKLTHTA